MNLTGADLLALCATALAVVGRLPQLRKLACTRDIAGVSLASPVLGCVNECAWVGYTAAVGLWPAVPSATLMAVANLAAVGLVLSAGAAWTRAVFVGGVWAVLLVVTGGFGGMMLLGTALTLAYLVQAVPAVWVVYTVARPTGVAPATWVLLGAEMALWAGYGLVHTDPAYTGLGAIGVSAAVLVLLRVSLSRGRPG